MRILLIIPAYNEASCILDTCNTILNFKEKHRLKSLDIIVINDGSQDNTSKICNDNNIPVISLSQNLGIGGAVQTGYKYASLCNYDIAIQYDGDGQHNINYFKKLINPIINNNADMVIGSRFIDKNSSDFKSSKSRRAGIKIISLLINIFTGKKIYDTTSGFRAVNSKIIDMFSKSYPSEYPEPISILDLIKNNYIIKEVPVSMNERKAGTSSIKSWKSAYYMINVIFTMFIELIGGWKNEF